MKTYRVEFTEAQLRELYRVVRDVQDRHILNAAELWGHGKPGLARANEQAAEALGPILAQMRLGRRVKAPCLQEGGQD